MRWLILEDVVALHETIMRGMGWNPAPLRDQGALESAIMRPQMAFQYEDDDLVSQAALLAIGISQAQAFLDGNKRTAYAVLEVFLLVNGMRLNIDAMEIARKLELVAEAEDRRAAVDSFEAWLRGVVVPKE